MKFAYLAFVLSLLSPPASAQSEAKTVSVSLNDAVSYALDHNFEITRLTAALDEMKAKVGRAASAYYPKLGLVGGSESAQSGRDSETVPLAYINGRYNLYNGGRDALKREIAKSELEKAQMDLDLAKLSVSLEVEQYFQRCVQLKTLIGLKEQAIATNNAHKSTVEKRQASNLVSQTDVMEFAVRGSLLESEYVSLKMDLDEARIHLKKLLGEEIGGNIEPIGTLPNLKLKGGMMDFVQVMKQRNLHIAESSRNIQTSKLGLQSAHARWLPQINFEARAGWLPLSDRKAPEDSGVTLLLTADYDLFSGFDHYYETKERLAQVGQAEAHLKHDILNALADVESLFRKLKAIEVRIELEEKNLDRMQKYYDSIRTEYGRGYKNSSDLVAASERLIGAAERRENYKYDFLVKKVELEKLLGSKVEVEQVPDPTPAKK